MNARRIRLSAVVIALNEADNLSRCLPRLIKVADDVVVIDAFSTDETETVCRGAPGVRLIRKPWHGYSRAKNFGNSVARHDWVLSVDADEVLSDELIQSINGLHPAMGSVYALDRITSYCGAWVRHSGWYPDWKTRIFNRNEARWGEEREVHERLVVPESVVIERLPGKLFHYSYSTTRDHFQRIELYAGLSAREMNERGVRLPRMKRFLFPAVRFLRTYLLKLGFLDGKAGLAISRNDARMIRRRYEILAEIRSGRASQ